MRMGDPLLAVSVLMPAKRFSPGANGLRNCFMAGICLPCSRIFKTNSLPLYMRDSIARSLATAIVKPGGLNVA